MMTDPLSDMLTRIRNAIQAGHKSLDMPSSKLKSEIAKILKNEGYIQDYEVVEEKIQNTLRIDLRYVGENMECPIHGLKRVSRPGRRVYAKRDEIPKVLGGLGIAIISTSKGLLTGRDAEKAEIGGEVLCSVW